MKNTLANSIKDFRKQETIFMFESGCLMYDIVLISNNSYVISIYIKVLTLDEVLLKKGQIITCLQIFFQAMLFPLHSNMQYKQMTLDMYGQTLAYSA